jgi:hypothetical protein
MKQQTIDEEGIAVNFKTVLQITFIEENTTLS